MHHTTTAFTNIAETTQRVEEMKFGGEKKMTLEEYVDFFVSGNSIDFTIAYLNQILHLHGFRKLHKFPKKIVGGAVDALDLLDLSRSTLKETTVSSSPSSSSLSLDQVITDIEALKWQECCLTSLQIINSQEITRAVSKPKQKYNKRKKATTKKSLNAYYGDENDITMIPAIPKKMRNKKTKKNAKIITTPVKEAALPKPLSHNNFPSRFTTIP